MLTVPNAAEVIWLDAVTGKTAATAWTLRLYTAISPAISNATIAAHVTEAAGGGYAAKALTAASWTTTAGSPTQTVQPQQTFNFTGSLSGAASVLGYYLTNAAGALVAIEPLPAPFQPASAADVIQVTLQLTLGSVQND